LQQGRGDEHLAVDALAVEQHAVHVEQHRVDMDVRRVRQHEARCRRGGEVRRVRQRTPPCLSAFTIVRSSKAGQVTILPEPCSPYHTENASIASALGASTTSTKSYCPWV